MELINTGNVGIRRRHVEAQDVFAVSGMFFISDNIPMQYCTSGIFSLQWADFNGVDANASLQGSFDGDTWNMLDAGGTTLDAATDTQLWEFTEVSVLYIRLVLTFKSVTDGMFGFKFRGEFNNAKNY